jgi:hypothetical protein
MKNFCSASLIIAALLIILPLVACESLGIRNLLADDQVPQAVKDEPRVVVSPPAAEEKPQWPRLGDVPSKPKDFSPKPVYDHYMDELAYDRDDAQATKKEIESETNATEQTPAAIPPAPPQFPQK